MSKPPPIPGQQPKPVPLKAPKKNRRIAIAVIVLFLLPTIVPILVYPFLDHDELEERQRARKAEIEEKARKEEASNTSSGCGWGGCKDKSEEPKKRRIRRAPPKQDPPGDQTVNARQIQIGMTEKEVHEVFVTMRTGVCKTDLSEVHSYYNGNDHPWVLVYYQNGKVADVDPGPDINPALLRHQKAYYRTGSCDERDPR